MQDEIWKPVPSKPEIMASNYGRIKFPDRIAVMPRGGIREYKPKPITGSVCRASKGAKHEFYIVRNSYFGTLKVHRLICEAFHGLPPFERAVVIHIDENALNNRPENLRWGTQKENLNMPKFIEYCKSRTGENNPYVKGRKAKGL